MKKIKQNAIGVKEARDSSTRSTKIRYVCKGCSRFYSVESAWSAENFPIAQKSVFVPFMIKLLVIFIICSHMSLV